MFGLDTTGDTAHGAIATALNAESGAPARIPLVPAGPIVEGVDGRTFRNDDPATVIAAFNAVGQDLPIDIEHATEKKGPNGDPAPAVGWIKALNVENGAIIADVDWTEEGARLVASRAYRYISPAILFRKSNSRIVGLSSAGLTNKPNFRLPALNSQDRGTVMDRATICAALGIVAAATDSDIESAINRLKNAAATPDPEKFVPKADLQAALNRATAAEQRLAERDKAELEAKIVTAVDQAVKDGKIAPASKEHYLALCRGDGGLQKFESLVATLPKLTATVLDDKAPDKTAGALSADEKALCRQLGLSEDDYRKARDADKETA